ncbi:MAG: cation:proton antiporter [Candidatus Baltobacteraceae bacterium]
MRLWQIAALLAAGLVFGELAPRLLTESFRALTLYVFLPALIFEAAWNLDFELMRRAWRPIVLLAIPGVALTAALIALALHRLGGADAATALLIGVVLSATDPVAVVAIFRRLRVPKMLQTIVESESLLNDAVAVVLYRAVLAAVLAGASGAEVGRISMLAVVGSIGGIAIGAVIGALAAFALSRQLGAAVQTAATFVAAYGGYILAERLHASGIFAVVACAIAMRELERRRLSLEVAKSVERVWHAAGITANVALFFLIGAAVEIAELSAHLRLVAVTLVAVFIARIVVAYGLLALVPRMLRSWKSVVRLAGVRGALSLALALAVPTAFPGRDRVVDAAFAVVVFTILASALTIERRVSRLDLTR